MQAQTICLLASQIAKGGTGMVSIAGQFLNLVLEDLKLKRNLKVNRVTQIITVNTGTYGPFALEADYLRTYDMFYPIPPSGGGTVGGVTQFLTPITMEQFDAEFKDAGFASYPYEFATDLSTQAQVWSGGSQGDGILTSAGFFKVYPQSSGSITVTHRYMKNQPDLITPAQNANDGAKTPWFADTTYLIEETASRMMGITGDSRKKEFHDNAEAMLRPYLIEEGDEQQAVHNIKLDPRHFHGPRGLRPVKSYPF